MLIPRDVLTRELADFDGLGQQVSLAQERGGFRLQSLRAGSFLQRAGLREGDLLTRVDGRPMASIDDCAAAYASLRVASRFTVEVERGGKSVELRFVVGAPQAAQR
jgi:S1-C subfamily serine protease